MIILKRTAKGCHINNGTDSLCECLNIIQYCNISVVASLVLLESLPKRSHFTCLNPKKQHCLQPRNMSQTESDKEYFYIYTSLPIFYFMMIDGCMSLGTAMLLSRESSLHNIILLSHED